MPAPAPYSNSNCKPKPVLIAHSLGGLVAMKLLERPALRAALGGVCLLCSVPPSGNGPMVGRFVRERFLSALKVCVRWGGGGGMG